MRGIVKFERWFNAMRLTNLQIESGTGAIGIGDSNFELNAAMVGGAMSFIDANETGTTPLYVQVRVRCACGSWEPQGSSEQGTPTVEQRRIRSLCLLLLQSCTFVCNGAVVGSGNAINNGNTQGDNMANLAVVTSNFMHSAGCAVQDVLGECEGAPGQCPRK
jgi:hypothetical protein